MSYGGVNPRETSPSESQIVIDACLDRIRKDAGLDAESVQPPLHVLVHPRPYERPTPEASAARLSANAAALAAPLRLTTRSASSPDPVCARVSRRRPWPVRLCGIVALCCATMAVMKSPLSSRPAARRAASEIERRATHAYSMLSASTPRSSVQR